MEGDDRLIYLISTAHHLMKGHMVARFRESGLEITPSHSTILFLLEERGPMQMNEIGAAMHIENPTVTGLVDRLENKGFVERVIVENDRRKWNVTITASGRNEIEKARGVIHAINAEIADGMTKKELDAFKKALNGFFVKFGGLP